MKGSMTNVEACTDEELEQKLACVLAYGAGETLNDSEVYEFTSSAKRFNGARSL